MANFQPPPTWALPVLVDERTQKAIFNPIWLKWFVDLTGVLNAAGGTTPNIHNNLTSIQGGGATERYHLTSAEAAILASGSSGSGALVRVTGATLVSPALGTPSALVGTNITGTATGLTAGAASAVALGGVTGLGTGVATALAVNIGSAGAPALNGGALGTPTSLVATNATGTAAGLTAGNVTTNANLTGHITSVGNAAVLGSFTSAQLAAALTDETGTGVALFATAGTEVGIAAALVKSLNTLNNGAAAAAGTLLNAPAAGNPTKWIPINDNGTVRYVPAW